jgi:hypothetical protein
MMYVQQICEKIAFYYAEHYKKSTHNIYAK